ncbi:MAG: hypothetical protein KF873_18650 [Gemmataceae bacterium]|nr:hypothetical protein [Gemmataceae bacterium]
MVVERETGADALDHFVLRTLATLGPSAPAEIDSVLHLKVQVIRQLLGPLERSGLVRETGSGFELTPEGAEVARTGRTRESGQERRVFHFLHPSMEYLPVSDPKGRVLRDVPPREGWEFDRGVLLACARQSPDWKRERGFPPEVVDLVLSDEGGQPVETPADSALIVDKAQEALCVVALSGDAAGAPVELAAHGVSPRAQFVGPADRPFCVLRGAEAISRGFPQLLQPPAPDAVRAAWSEVAALNALTDHDRAVVRFDGSALVAVLTAEQVLAWVNFATQADRGEQTWLCRVEGADLVVPVRFEPVDPAAATALQTVREIIEMDEQRARAPASVPQLAEELAARTGKQYSPRSLSELAWRIERYALASALAELEDIADADVSVPLR